MNKEKDINKEIMIIRNKVDDYKDKSINIINNNLITLYYRIGKYIYINNQIYGNRFVTLLSKTLLMYYPGRISFTESNLYRMKTFYEEYKEYDFLPLCIKNISWTLNNLLIERIRNKRRRLWYAEQCYRCGWNSSELIYQMENEAYEKSLIKKVNTNVIINNTSNEIIKDQYTLDINNNINKDLKEIIIEEV